MLLSASRRTDIPAFYSEWFMNRIKNGIVKTRNPFNPAQTKEIVLTPENIDCIIFWTKNPAEMLDKVEELEERGYDFYFQFTLTSYDQTLEPEVPKKKYLVDTFCHLAEKIGKEKVVWRYDPILLTEKIDKQYHFRYFDFWADKLKNHTERCIISFLDLYRKTERKLASFNLQSVTEEDKREIAKKLKEITDGYGLRLETCAESVDLSGLDISPGKCVDDRLIEKITGNRLDISQDKNQRDNCHCIKSVDIGAYDTCQHNCLYCYANQNDRKIRERIKKHDPQAPFLLVI